MPLLSTRNDPQKSKILRRDDWTEVALLVLRERGMHAVQITELARQLGVTRGSFYWHFESREAVMHAIIKEWRARNSGIMIEALNGARDLEEGILALFKVWTEHDKFDPRLDQAVRDWARTDDDVSAMLDDEDNNRVSAIAAFFRSKGYAKDEAFIRARILYFTQVSYYALHVREPMGQRLGYLELYYRCFTGFEISKRGADNFRAQKQIDGEDL